VLGGSDAGAHLDLITTYNYPTELLAKAVRAAEVISLEEAIHLLTQRPAELYGLRDRGTIAEGTAADLLVLNEHEVASEPPATRFDLPGGAMRRFAAARGIEHVFCNGVEVQRAGAPTGARPGRVLRAGRDTYTPAMA
jgi:N-acyl-D-aspartate/D-glutamate deacylase